MLLEQVFVHLRELRSIFLTQPVSDLKVAQAWILLNCHRRGSQVTQPQKHRLSDAGSLVKDVAVLALDAEGAGDVLQASSDL